MSVPFKFRTISAVVAVAAATGLLAACGGSDDDDGPPAVAVSGVAAVGDPLVAANVALTCADGSTITGITNAQGNYTTNAANLRLPCIGQATKAPTSYRGILLSGATANFTALTDILVEVVLAAAAPGGTSLSLTDFLTKIRTDATFAANVTAPATVAAYRTSVVEVVKEQLIAAGLDPSLADVLLTANFESAPFLTNGTDPLDKVLDDTKTVLQDANGNVPSDVKEEAKAEGDTLPTPPSTATGGTGATGGSGT